MNLHLFSNPGENDIRYIVEASRPHLEKKDDPIIAYMPLASLYAEKWLEFIQSAFGELGQVKTINAELMSQKEIEGILRDASLVYVPGGNTFLLNHRLHVSGVMAYLKKKVQSGLPYMGHSAGSILCGPNILTSKDLNTVPTPHFEGLNVVPFNISPHYPKAAYGQSVKDEWLAEYHFFYDNLVVIMWDAVFFKVDGKRMLLV